MKLFYFYEMFIKENDAVVYSPVSYLFSSTSINVPADISKK